MPAGGRFGLIIANSRYADPALTRLSGPEHDAEALAGVLGNPAIGGFEVATLINRNASDALVAVAKFCRDRRRDDLLLLYFSGHGIKDEDGHLYLATANTDRQLPEATAVPARFIREQLDRARSRQIVLVLDCCYSGAFAQGAKGDNSVHTREGFGGAAGCVVLTASDELEYAFEDGPGEGGPVESVFTRILVEGLTTGAADRDADGDVSLDELYDYAHDRMRDERPQQRPRKWAWDVYGRIVVARNPQWTLPARLRDTLDSPIASYRLAAVEELGQLLRGGNSVVAAQVQDALTRLADDDSKKVSAAAAALLSPPPGPGGAAGSGRPSPAQPERRQPSGPQPAGHDRFADVGQTSQARQPAEAGWAGRMAPTGEPGRRSWIEAVARLAAGPPAADSSRGQQRRIVAGALDRVDSPSYGKQRAKLLAQVTGTGQLLGMCRCWHRSDHLRHTLLLFTTDYLAWAREGRFLRTSAGRMSWRDVEGVEEVAVAGIRVAARDGSRLEIDTYLSKGVTFIGEPMEFDLESIQALVRLLAAKARS